jgi:Na+/H+-dicarboxylate symporter
MNQTSSTPAPRRRGISLTTQIFIGLALGVVIGAIIDATNPAWAIYFRPFSQLFLRLIKMIIAPLIFATLVAGIAGAGHVKVVGRMGLRAIIYFEIVNRCSTRWPGGMCSRSWPSASSSASPSG